MKLKPKFANFKTKGSRIFNTSTKHVILNKIETPVPHGNVSFA